MNKYDEEPYVEPMGPGTLFATLVAILIYTAGFWIGVLEIARWLIR